MGHSSSRRLRGLHGSGVVALLTGLAVPFALAIAWIPIRSRVPNADLALVLVVAVTAVGALGRRSAVAMAAVSSALWFEFFDTKPYERLAIARNPDVETTLVLALVAVVAGDLAVRAVWHRHRMRAEAEKLGSLRSAAALVTSGEELVKVIEAVVAELTRLLDLESCCFESDVAGGSLREVTRDGELVASWPSASSLGPGGGPVVLPVVAQHSPVGRFVLAFKDGAPPSKDRLQVAVALGDHVGAAFLAQAPPPLPPEAPEPLRALHVVTARFDAHEGVGTPPVHPTAGRSRDEDRMIS